jgi:hypothetical protein
VGRQKAINLEATELPRRPQRVMTAEPKSEANRKLNVARRLIERAEADLDCTLTNGQRRDLLMDNTAWDRSFIVECVAYLAVPDAQKIARSEL